MVEQAASPPIHATEVHLIRAFCDARGISASTFGARYFRDPSFVFDLEAGREMKARTMARLARVLAGEAE